MNKYCATERTNCSSCESLSLCPCADKPQRDSRGAKIFENLVDERASQLARKLQSRTRNLREQGMPEESSLIWAINENQQSPQPKTQESEDAKRLRCIKRIFGLSWL